MKLAPNDLDQIWLCLEEKGTGNEPVRCLLYQILMLMKVPVHTALDILNR